MVKGHITVFKELVVTVPTVVTFVKEVVVVTVCDRSESLAFQAGTAKNASLLKLRTRFKKKSLF